MFEPKMTTDQKCDLERVHRNMEAANDPIKTLLDKTGLSCDDLLQKLLAYKLQEKESRNVETVYANCSEVNYDSYANNDATSSGNINDSSTENACGLDFGNGSECNNEEICSSSENSSVISGIETPNSTKIENRTTSKSLEKFCPKKKNSCKFEGTVDAQVRNVLMELQSCQMSIGENISRNISNDSEHFAQRNVNPIGALTSEESSEDTLTKETHHNTPDEENIPKKYVEIPKTHLPMNEDLIPSCEISSIHLEEFEGENISENIDFKNIYDNIESQSNGQKCSAEDIEDIIQPQGSTENDASEVDDISNSSEKIENTLDHSPKLKTVQIFIKRKSISDELVRRLVERVNEDEINESKDESIDREQVGRNTEQVSERSGNISDVKDMKTCRENDIEVCQLEHIEVVEPAEPLLKLRSDLFQNNIIQRFTTLKSKFDNEKDDYKSMNTKDVLVTLEKVNNSSGEIKILENNSADNVVGTETTDTKMRKVKAGFLKKKILHKAIRHLSRADSKKLNIVHKKKISESRNIEEDIDHYFQMPLPKLILEPHVDTPEAQEEVRKNLKLQLNSLRNRKKIGSMMEQGQCKKIQSMSDLKFNFKKQILSDEVQNNSTSLSTSTSNTPPADIEESQSSASNVRRELSADNFTAGLENNDSSLFSLSEETNFMIVDVQGGVEIPDCEIDDRSKEFHHDGIKLTKTNDITKIKGWKNKKFDVIMKKDTTDSEKDVSKIQTEDTINDCDSLSAANIIRDDSNTAETLKMDENSSEELSPFVSNTLEEFLTANSRLNISYKIPKLGAEEGLSKVNYKDVVLPKTLDPSITPEPETKGKPKGIKPKTLAEKRRMLEGKILKKGHFNKGEKPLFWKTSYIHFNGSKIYIPSTKNNKCLGYITFKPLKCTRQSKLTDKSDSEENEVITPKKISLLKLWLEKSKIVTYKPGPLSQKAKLQNSETISTWDTVVQKLPKIKLEIIPEYRKAVPPHLVSLLPKPSPVLKSDYLEFALSAVQTKSADEQRQGFRFCIPYRNNQKYILIRKKKEKCGEHIVCDIEPEKNSVASVIDDIISYVEIKEIQDSIIKDAEPYKEHEYENEIRAVITNEINIVEDGIAKKNIKRRKLEMELHRLSCKVVSVTVEEKEIIDADCKKSYCKLGCICRSLACVSQLPLHCSKKDCMFECKCSANSEIALSGDSSLLSSDTMTRIQDQAKRNLAKVEKEFTQTIIHANNKTILIPSSDRSKTKRVKRTPKRYSDFLEDYDIEEKIVSIPKEIEKVKVCKNSNNYNCYVELEKLDLKGIVPLCLDHNSYYCSCTQDIEPNTERKRNIYTDDESVVEESISPKKIKKRKTHEDDNTVEEPNMKLNDRPSSGDNSETDYNRSITICEKKKKKRKKGCARICGVHPEFIVRNEIPYYRDKLLKYKKNTENLCVSLHLLPQNLNYKEADSCDFIDVTTPFPISGCDRLKLLQNEYTCHRRKQVLEVRDDYESVTSHKVKKVKRKKKKSLDSFNESLEEITPKNLPYTSIFDGEIVIPTNANKDFVKNLGVKSVAPYMRLLPWNDLLRNYYSLKINIWCSHDKSDKLLINVNNIKPPEGYVDISQSKRKNGIMMWILTKELPKQTPAELVHLILSPNNEHFEISGICLKNIPNSKEKNNIDNESDHEHIKINDTEEETINDNGNSQELVNVDPNFLKHKNHNNELNVLCLTQHEFCPQYFHLAPTCEGMCNEKFPLPVELPIIRPQFRWRMLYLNSNFSFLSFINNKYSIKYTDLMHILKKAQRSNKTICLQSKQLSSGYTQKNYGIYAVPKYRDRLFIGPYKHDEEHGLETLRYLRQSLVSTSYFEMVQGGANPNNKNAVWLTTKMGRLRDKESGASNLSLLLALPQQSLLKPNLRKLISNAREDTEIYNEENEQFAELTPIINVSPLISDNSSPESLIIGTSSETMTSTIQSETTKQNDQTNELQGISEHSKLLEGCENFVTTMDLEEKPFIKFPEFILLNGRKMKPQEYNRYIMTNIPHFGYLGAIQNEQSKSIDIDWPFANKVLRFPNVTAATEFLKRRFTNLLLPVPASFQINLIILREIESSNHSPIDARILSGTHICGEFGVLDSRKLTLPLAESLGTTQEDVLKRLAKRAQYLVRCRLRTLGLFLLPKDEQLEEVLDNVAYITNLGALEIGKLKEQEKLFIQMKKDLIIRKQNNLAKYMELLMHLPEKQRLNEYDKFRHQFNERPKYSSKLISTPPSGATKEQEVIECIEIEDSDSDNDMSNVTPIPKHVKRPQQKTSSPKKQFVMKSVIKSFKPPSPVSPSLSDPKPLEGYKFVKTSSGKLVLLKDKSGLTLSTSLSGMKMTIRNNQVIKKDIISNSNNTSEFLEGTNNQMNKENSQELVEVMVENNERDSIVELDLSDEDDSEVL